MFHFLTKSAGWYQFGLACWVASVASGVAAYIWLKSMTSPSAALIAAVLYMAMPYHLAVDLYRRAAVGEYWTFVWMPMILHFARRIVCGDKLALVGLSVSYALLIMTHPLITLIFSMIPVVYVLFVADESRRLKTSIRVIASMGLGIGLSAIYLVPALITRNNVVPEDLQFGYSDHFLFAGLSFALLKPYFTTLVTFLSQVTAVTLGVAYVSFTFARNNSDSVIRNESYYWFIIVIASLCMMLPVSKPIWTLFPVLQTLSFPWRLMTVMTVATAALVALAIYSLERPLSFFPRIRIIIASLFVISWIFPTATIIKRNFWSQRTNANIEQFIDYAGLRPRWVEQDKFTPAAIEKLNQNPAKAMIIAGQGSVVTQQWKAREIVLKADATTDVWLAVKQFYYPGWTAQLAGVSAPLAVRPSKGDGLLNVWAPSGTHEILLELRPGIAEQIGQVVSAVTLAIILFLAFGYCVSQPKLSQITGIFRKR
jgi:hypothetical protein